MSIAWLLPRTQHPRKTLLRKGFGLARLPILKSWRSTREEGLDIQALLGHELKCHFSSSGHAHTHARLFVKRGHWLVLAFAFCGC